MPHPNARRSTFALAEEIGSRCPDRRPGQLVAQGARAATSREATYRCLVSTGLPAGVRPKSALLGTAKAQVVASLVAACLLGATASTSAAPKVRAAATTTASRAAPWSVGLVAIATADLVPLRDRLLTDLLRSEHLAVLGAVLTVDLAGARLLVPAQDGGGWLEVGRAPLHDWLSLAEALGARLATSGDASAVVLWGHGQGDKGFGADLGRRHRPLMLRVRDGQLAELVSRIHDGGGRKVDVLAFDACGMATWTNLGQLTGHVGIAVASPDYLPLAGLPIVSWLGDLSVPIAAELASTRLVASVAKQGRRYTSMTALDLRTWPRLADIAAPLLSQLSAQCRAHAKSADPVTWRYRMNDAVDLGVLLEAAVASPTCPAATQREAKEALAHLRGSRVAHHCRGVSCAGVGVATSWPDEEGNVNSFERSPSR